MTPWYRQSTQDNTDPNYPYGPGMPAAVGSSNNRQEDGISANESPKKRPYFDASNNPGTKWKYNEY